MAGKIKLIFYMLLQRSVPSLKSVSFFIFCRAIDAGSEWRTFGSERCGGQASRVGGPENPLLCGSDLGTTIAGLHEGDSMNGRKKFQGQRNVENVDRILLRAFKEISAMGEQLGLSKTVMDSANHMFKVRVCQIVSYVLYC